MEEETPPGKESPSISKTEETASKRPSVGREFFKGWHILFWQYLGLDKVADDVDTHEGAVRKGALLRFVVVVSTLFAVTGFLLKGCMDSSVIDSAKTDLLKSQGETREAERQADKYQILYNVDQHNIAEVGTLEKAKPHGADDESSEDQKIKAIVDKAEQDTEKRLLDAISQPKPSDAIVASIASTPVPAIDVKDDKPDENAAVKELASLALQAQAEDIQNKEASDAVARKMSINCATQIDTVIQTLTAFLQHIATDNGDAISSDYKGVPNKLTSDFGCTIALRSNKSWSFAVSFANLSGDPRLQVLTPLKHNSPDSLRAQFYMSSGAENYTDVLSRGSNNIIRQLGGKPSEFNVQAKDILNLMIYEKKSDDPPSPISLFPGK